MPSSTLAQPALEMSTNWSRLFNDINELHRATMQVVAIRMTRMAMAGPTPDARDRLELSLMSHDTTRDLARTHCSGTGVARYDYPVFGH